MTQQQLKNGIASGTSSRDNAERIVWAVRRLSAGLRKYRVRHSLLILSPVMLVSTNQVHLMATPAWDLPSNITIKIWVGNGTITVERAQPADNRRKTHQLDRENGTWGLPGPTMAHWELNGKRQDVNRIIDDLLFRFLVCGLATLEGQRAQRSQCNQCPLQLACIDGALT